MYCRRKRLRGVMMQEEGIVRYWRDGVLGKPERLSSRSKPIPIFSDALLLTSDTESYRQLAASQVDSDDKVVEIGCSTGQTSVILARNASHLVALDTGTSMVEQTQKALGAGNTQLDRRILCARVDALVEQDQTLALARTFGSPSVVFVDIGGNREEYNVRAILKWVRSALPDLRLVVVKSQALYQSTSDTVDKETWWMDLETACLQCPKHPLQAPMKLVDNVPICRYHNYHSGGCLKGTRCPYDHIHCHHCLAAGHRAIDCTATTV